MGGGTARCHGHQLWHKIDLGLPPVLTFFVTKVKSYRFSDPNFPWCKMNSTNSKKRFKSGLAHGGPVRMNKVRVLRAWLSALWRVSVA